MIVFQIRAEPRKGDTSQERDEALHRSIAGPGEVRWDRDNHTHAHGTGPDAPRRNPTAFGQGTRPCAGTAAV